MNEAKYRIGQKVWLATTRTTSGAWPCPDCLGEKTWLATTRAGEVITVQCPRCQGHQINRSIPSLNRNMWVIETRPLTIGSVRTDTAARGGEQVSYMCEETGVGSGTIYYETLLFATEQEAADRAAVLTAEAQAKTDAAPYTIRAFDFGLLPLQVAITYAWQADVYAAWTDGRRYREAMDKVLAGDIPGTVRDILTEAIQEHPWSRPDWAKILAAVGVEVPV